MEPLLKYFIDETNKKIDDLKADVSEGRKETREVRDKLSDLQAFKVEMVVSARWVSLLVSAACGLLTMLATAYLNHKLKLGG